MNERSDPSERDHPLRPLTQAEWVVWSVLQEHTMTPYAGGSVCSCLPTYIFDNGNEHLAAVIVAEQSDEKQS